MKRKIFILSILLCSLFSLAAKDKPELASTLIPESLTKGANSVVRDRQTEFVYINKAKGTEIHHEEITILNEKGLDEAYFLVFGDQYKKLKQFSAVLYNAAGKEIKQYKKSDVATSQWSQNLATDDVRYYWSCVAPSYPFTVVFDYEVEWKDGLVFFPPFDPQNAFDQTVQQASYTLQIPSNLEILVDGNKFIGAPSKTEAQNVTTYTWSVKDVASVEAETFAPATDELCPLLLIVPKLFYYDGYEGSFESVKTMGEFQTKLNEKRNTLTEATKQKMLELTKNASSDKEKVRILYDYLGKNTRYESIQLGIGGWQPIESGSVCKNGFGDCKGLSFYLKSMLEAVGILSNYTVIRLDEDKKALKNNFTAFLSTNHVILQVPLPNDTLWLECTNTQVPFGFVHNKIAGHNAVVITANGGFLQRLPEYPDSVSVSENKIRIQFKTGEPTAITVRNENRIKAYDRLFGFPDVKPSEQIDFIRKKLQIPNASISDLKVVEDKSAQPQLAINYKVSAFPYGTSTGSRYFVPSNAFRSDPLGLRKNKRVNDILIPDGWKNADDIEIEIPDNTEVEYLPPTTVLSSPFGDFHSGIQQAGKEIHIRQELLIHRGRWTPDRYKELQEFINKVTAIYGDAIVLKSK